MIAAAVAVSAGDWLAAAGNGWPAHSQNSWELHATFRSRINAAETIKTIVGLLYPPHWDVINKAFIKVPVMGAKLCHHRVRTNGVDSERNHPADTVKFVRSNLEWWRMKILSKMTQYTCACIINCVNNVLFGPYVVLHLLDQTRVGPWSCLVSRPTDNLVWWSYWGQSKSDWFHQSMIYLFFLFVVRHTSMTSKYPANFESLGIKTCTPKLIVKTTMKQEGNFELTSWKFGGHVNLSLANSQATIFQSSVSDIVEINESSCLISGSGGPLWHSSESSLGKPDV